MLSHFLPIYKEDHLTSWKRQGILIPDCHVTWAALEFVSMQLKRWQLLAKHTYHSRSEAEVTGALYPASVCSNKEGFVENAVFFPDTKCKRWELTCSLKTCQFPEMPPFSSAERKTAGRLLYNHRWGYWTSLLRQLAKPKTRGEQALEPTSKQSSSP